MKFVWRQGCTVCLVASLFGCHHYVNAQIPVCGEELRDELGQLIPVNDVTFPAGKRPGARYFGSTTVHFSVLLLDELPKPKIKVRSIEGNTVFSHGWAPRSLTVSMEFLPCQEGGKLRGYPSETRVYEFWYTEGSSSGGLGILFEKFDELPQIVQGKIVRARVNAISSPIGKFSLKDGNYFLTHPLSAKLGMELYSEKGEFICRPGNALERQGCKKGFLAAGKCQIVWRDPRKNSKAENSVCPEEWRNL